MFKKVALLTLPVFVAYFSIGFVYGFLFEQEGYAWYWAPIYSATIFSGAVQFLALSLMATKTSAITIFLAAAPIAMRNMFYGINFIERYNKRPLAKPLLAFGLVDATYSLLLLNKEEDDKKDFFFYSLLSFFIYLYWVIGTGVGAICAQYVQNTLEGLEFTLTALLITLTIDQYKRHPSNSVFVISSLAGIITLFFYPEHFFLGALSLSLIGIITWNIKGIIHAK